MDIVSQILLSICFSYAFFYKIFGYWTILIAFLCTIIIDIPPFFTHSDLFDGLDHAESFSHSLFMMLILGSIGAGIGFFIFKKARAFISLVCLNYTVHVLIDLSASNGVTLLAPLSTYAPAFQSLSRWDAFFIFPLLLGISLSLIFSKIKWAQFSFVYTLFYVLSAHLLSIHAYKSTASIFKQIGFSPKNIHITTPPLFFFTRRLSVKDTQNRFACTFYSPFLQRPPEIFITTSVDNALIKTLLNNKEGTTFSKFTHDMTLVQIKNDSLFFFDARHGSFIDPWASPYRAYASANQTQNPSLTISQNLPRRPFRDEIPQAWKLLFPPQTNSR